MIPNLKHNASIYHTLHYAIQKEGAYEIGMVRGTPQELTDTFYQVLNLNPGLKNPVLHLSLSIHPTEHLEDHQWEEAARITMEGLGYGNTPYVVVRHTDEPHEHIHIITVRIDCLTGKAVKDSFEKLNASKICAALEEKYHLRQAAFRMYSQAAEKNLDLPEWNMRAKRKFESLKAKLKIRIHAACARSETMSDLVGHLERYGVGLIVNASQQRITGVTYEIFNWTMKGSALGKLYSWSGLCKRLDYDQDRDFKTLTTAKNRLGLAPDRLAPELLAELEHAQIQMKRAEIQAYRQRYGKAPDPKTNPMKALKFEEVLTLLATLSYAVHTIHPKKQDQEEEETSFEPEL